MEFYNFPWSLNFGVYDMSGWFSPGTQMMISLFLDYSLNFSSPGEPAILNLTVTNIGYV